jgi:hypothetical protein
MNIHYFGLFLLEGAILFSVYLFFKVMIRNYILIELCWNDILVCCQGLPGIKTWLWT